MGSVEETTEQMYVYDKDKEAIIKKSVTYVPGLYKIFDEILGERVPEAVESVCAHVCVDENVYIN